MKYRAEVVLRDRQGRVVQVACTGTDAELVADVANAIRRNQALDRESLPAMHLEEQRDSWFSFMRDFFWLRRHRRGR